MADKDTSQPPRPRGVPQPGMSPDLSPHAIEAALREGNRLRAEAARGLFLAAGAGAASLWARATSLLSGALSRRRHIPRTRGPSPNPSP